MDWTELPSLAALRAFEAAGRTGSLSAAARELNVTHAAIAQHLRALEAHFGRALMKRQGRGMALTEAGAQLFGPIRDGFTEIAVGVRTLAEDIETKPLTLSVTPSFAETWLMPRLGRFWEQHPDIPLSIQPTFAIADFHRDDVDMAVRFGEGNWPGLDVERLTRANYVIVAAPGVASHLRDRPVEAFKGQTFIFEPGFPESRRYLESNGLDLPDKNIRELPTFGMVLAAVRDGVGLTMLSRAIVEQDVKQGTLVALSESRDDTMAYWIVTRKGVVSKRLRLLKKWLKSVA